MFRLVLDGSEDCDRRAESMLHWDGVPHTLGFGLYDLTLFAWPV